MPCSGYCVKGHNVAYVLIIADVNFEHLNKVVSTRFCHHKVVFSNKEIFLNDCTCSLFPFLLLLFSRI